MIYELREYVAAPGRAAALHARFADHTLGLFARHGLSVIGFWTDQADEHRLVYLLTFPDAEAQRRAWAAFLDDPDWRRVKAATETGGRLVAELRSRTLTRVPYWPHETVSAGEPPAAP